MANSIVYDPSSVSLNIGGYKVVGLVELEAETPATSKTINGTDSSSSCRVKVRKFAPKLKFSLLQTSPSNKVLNQLDSQDDVTSFINIIVSEDTSGGHIILLNATGWLENSPNIKRAGDTTDSEWTFRYVATSPVTSTLN